MKIPNPFAKGLSARQETLLAFQDLADEVTANSSPFRKIEVADISGNRKRVPCYKVSIYRGGINGHLAEHKFDCARDTHNFLRGMAAVQ